MKSYRVTKVITVTKFHGSQIFVEICHSKPKIISLVVCRDQEIPQD